MEAVCQSSRCIPFDSFRSSLVYTEIAPDDNDDDGGPKVDQYVSQARYIYESQDP